MARGRGLYDVGLADCAADAIRARGEDPTDWTCVEVWDSRGRLRTAFVISRSDLEHGTTDHVLTWLNARDAYLRVG